MCSGHHHLEAVLGVPCHHRWQANCHHQLQDMDLDSGHNHAKHFLLFRLAMHRFHDLHQAGHYPLHHFVEVHQQCLLQEQVVFQVVQHSMHQDQDLVQAHQLAVHHQREHHFGLRPSRQRNLVLPNFEVDFNHLDRDY